MPPRKRQADSDGLNVQQRRFALEYLRDLNGKQAAIRAGYSPKSAEQQASALLSHPKVSDLVARRLAELEALKAASANRVIEELTRLAFLDLGGAFTETGLLRALHEMPEDVRRAISSVETDELFERADGEFTGRTQTGITRKLRTHDKLKALELLAKYHGLLIERREVKVTTTLEELITESMAPPEAKD